VNSTRDSSTCYLRTCSGVPHTSYTECERVRRGVGAWRAGDLVQFGACVSESGLSSIENYECGTEALIELREILLRTPGVLGARFSGAGFRGCCVALVWRCMAHQAAAAVATEHARCQPVLVKNILPGCVVIMSDSGDGARVLLLGMRASSRMYTYSRVKTLLAIGDTRPFRGHWACNRLPATSPLATIMYCTEATIHK